MNRLFVSFDLDDAGRKVGQATLNDDLNALHDASLHITSAVEVARNWIEGNGGTILEIGGDQGNAFLDPENKEKIQELKDEMEAAGGFTVTIGMGLTLSQASKSLIAGKLTGKNQIVEYSENVEQTLQNAPDEPDEAQKEQEAYPEAFAGDQGAEPTTDIGMQPDQSEDDGSGYQEEPGVEEDAMNADQEPGEEIEPTEEGEGGTPDFHDLDDQDDGEEEIPAEQDEEGEFADEAPEMEEEVELPEADDKDVEKANEDESAPVAGEDPDENAQDNREADAKDIALARLDQTHDVKMDDMPDEFQADSDPDSVADDGQMPTMGQEQEFVDGDEQAGQEPVDGEEDISAQSEALPEEGQEEVSEDPSQIKQRIAENLEMFKQNKDVIEQMKQQNPELYQSIVALIQNMIDMAKELNAGPQNMPKSERPLKKK